MKPQSPKFSQKIKPWKTIGSRKLLDQGEVKLFRDQLVSKSGFHTNHLRLSLNDFSIVIPVLNGDRIVFVWNYRHPIQGWELELPAGLVDDGEDPENCAKRELQEETGYSATSWKGIGWLYTLPGISSQRAHVYLAEGLKKGIVHRTPYEFMKVKLISVRTVYRSVWAGEIVHSPTVSALGLAQRILLL